jgi:hypothetical protein
MFSRGRPVLPVFVRPSASFIGSFPVSTMKLPAGVPVTSQSIRVWFESSLGKVNILLSIAATSTISALSLFRALDFGSMCYLIRRQRQVLIASVCFTVRNGIAPMGLPQWNCPNGIAPMELPQWNCRQYRQRSPPASAVRLLQMVSQLTHPYLLLSLG